MSYSAVSTTSVDGRLLWSPVEPLPAGLSLSFRLSAMNRMGDISVLKGENFDVPSLRA